MGGAPPSLKGSLGVQAHHSTWFPVRSLGCPLPFGLRTHEGTGLGGGCAVEAVFGSIEL